MEYSVCDYVYKLGQSFPKRKYSSDLSDCSNGTSLTNSQESVKLNKENTHKCSLPNLLERSALSKLYGKRLVRVRKDSSGASKFAEEGNSKSSRSRTLERKWSPLKLRDWQEKQRQVALDQLYGPYLVDTSAPVTVKDLINIHAVKAIPRDLVDSDEKNENNKDTQEDDGNWATCSRSFLNDDDEQQEKSPEQIYDAYVAYHRAKELKRRDQLNGVPKNFYQLTLGKVIGLEDTPSDSTITKLPKKKQTRCTEPIPTSPTVSRNTSQINSTRDDVNGKLSEAIRENRQSARVNDSTVNLPVIDIRPLQPDPDYLAQKNKRISREWTSVHLPAPREKMNFDYPQARVREANSLGLTWSVPGDRYSSKSRDSSKSMPMVHLPNASDSTYRNTAFLPSSARKNTTTIPGRLMKGCATVTRALDRNGMTANKVKWVPKMSSCDNVSKIWKRKTREFAVPAIMARQDIKDSAAVQVKTTIIKKSKIVENEAEKDELSTAISVDNENGSVNGEGSEFGISVQW